MGWVPSCVRYPLLRILSVAKDRVIWKIKKQRSFGRRGWLSICCHFACFGLNSGFLFISWLYAAMQLLYAVKVQCNEGADYDGKRTTYHQIL